VIVVDASAVLEVLLRTPAAAAVEARLLAPGETLHAPHLIDVEVAHVLRRCLLTGAIDPRRCGEALADLADLPLKRYPHVELLEGVLDMWSNLTAYDAVYVALAEALDAPLLTRDRKLAKAAGLRATVELV